MCGQDVSPLSAIASRKENRVAVRFPQVHWLAVHPSHVLYRRMYRTAGGPRSHFLFPQAGNGGVVPALPRPGLAGLHSLALKLDLCIALYHSRGPSDYQTLVPCWKGGPPIYTTTVLLC